jgi:predicted DNA-binding ribbon-helix-helix protein
MKSHAAKRSIVVAGHKTGVSLEEAFWNGMKEICGLRNMTCRSWWARLTTIDGRGICLRLSGCSFSTTSRTALSAGALASSPQIL